MTLLEELKEYGVDVDEGIERVMGNAALYQKMLAKMYDMIEGAGITPDFDSSNYAGLTEKVHAIKGTAGNMSITPLYEGYSNMLALLRADKPEEAREVLKEIMPVQEKILACIKKYI